MLIQNTTTKKTRTHHHQSHSHNSTRSTPLRLTWCVAVPRINVWKQITNRTTTTRDNRVQTTKTERHESTSAIPCAACDSADFSSADYEHTKNTNTNTIVKGLERKPVGNPVEMYNNQKKKRQKIKERTGGIARYSWTANQKLKFS